MAQDDFPQVGIKDFVLQPSVAVSASDKLIPRYVIRPYDPSLLEPTEFVGGGGAKDFYLRKAEKLDTVIVNGIDNGYHGEVGLWQSILGAPIYSMLEFPALDALKDLSPAGVLAKENIALSCDMAIFTINQSKNIIKTAIQGRNGTVKEYIGDGDYSISIEGHFVSPFSNYFPKEEVEQFIRIMKIKSQIPMVAPILQLFGISNVVVTGWSIDEMVGTRNMVPFTIECISDDDDSIAINNIETIW